MPHALYGTGSNLHCTELYIANTARSHRNADGVKNQNGLQKIRNEMPKMFTTVSYPRILNFLWSVSALKFNINPPYSINSIGHELTNDVTLTTRSVERHREKDHRIGRLTRRLKSQLS